MMKDNSHNQNSFPVQWALVLLAYITLFSLSLIDNSRGPAYPEILEDFYINAASGAWLFAWASFAALIANLSAKWWLPKIGIVKATFFALLSMGLGSFLFGYSINYGMVMLELSSFVMGFGMGMANISMNLLVAKATPETQRRQFFAGLHSIYGIGSLTAPLLLSTFMTFELTWSQYFQWLTLLPALTLLLVLLKKKKFQLTDNVEALPKLSLTAPVNLATRLAYGLLFGCYVASEIVVSSRLVVYLTHGHQFSGEQARLALSLFFLGLLGGRLVFTILPIKGSSQRWLITSCLTTISVYALTRWVSAYYVVLTGLTMSYFYPVAMDWLSKKFPKGLEWMTASVLTFISILLVFMHLGFGYVTDVLSIEAAMASVPIFQLICLALILKLGKAT